MMNKITSDYCKGKDAGRQNGKNCKAQAWKIIKTFKTKRILPDAHVNKSTIQTRAFRNKPLFFQPAGDKISPMFDVETQLFAIFVNMKHICHIISPTKGSQLSNYIIEGKPIEKKLESEKVQLIHKRQHRVMRQRCYIRSWILVWFYGTQQPLDREQV